jgi:hypothetical protein
VGHRGRQVWGRGGVRVRAASSAFQAGLGSAFRPHPSCTCTPRAHIALDFCGGLWPVRHPCLPACLHLCSQLPAGIPLPSRCCPVRHQYPGGRTNERVGGSAPNWSLPLCLQLAAVIVTTPHQLTSTHLLTLCVLPLLQQEALLVAPWPEDLLGHELARAVWVQPATRGPSSAAVTEGGPKKLRRSLTAPRSSQRVMESLSPGGGDVDRVSRLTGTAVLQVD